jgi:CubicO group peptidase (beta-lactamase class C family)
MEHLFLKRILCLTLTIGGLLSVYSPVSADTQRSLPKTAQRLGFAPPGPTDPEELEAFFDAIMARQMESYHIPGGVIAVVKDGELVFSKGYGYANLEKRIPFQPEKSLVRIASITKLFTWTAVMQLEEQNKLDLNADVNTYLTAFKVPSTFPEPITILDLMDHTTGFEDQNIGVFTRSAVEIPPLGEYLAKHMPARVRPPGIISAYSNYGADLAGYIVTQVSGMPYEQYIQENILDPLSMTRTTAQEPLPDNLLGDLAVDYRYVNGRYEPISFSYDVTAPDGSISATASDMAHFMIAHLQNGRYEGAQILRADTAMLIHSQSFTHNPQLPGWAHGFEELTINGQRALSHTGGKEGFRSLMLLLPEHNLGLFISFNGLDDFSAIDDLTRAFYGRYFPAAPAGQPLVQPDRPAQQFTGWYKSTISAETTIEKLVALVASSELTALDDRTLEFDGRRWTVAGPLLYRESNGETLMAFLPNERGKIAYLAIGPYSYERVPWYETINFTLLLLGSSMLLSLSALIGWPLIAFLQRRKQALQDAVPAASHASRLVAALGCGLIVVFITVLGLILMGNTSGFAFGVPPGIYFLMVLPIVATGVAVAVMICVVLAWKNGYWSVWGRLHFTLVALALAEFLWFANTWNLLGFHFG